jgi:integrase/recombinase XerC
MEFKSFLDYLLLEKKYSAKTIVAYKNDLVSFSVFNEREFSQKFTKNANYSQIRSWIVFLVDNEISNQSINRKISSLNSYYKFPLKTDSIIKNPLSSHKALKTKTTIQLPFSENEINFMENKTEIKNQYITSQGRLYLLGVSYYL